jgi:hypothetical protein
MPLGYEPGLRNWFIEWELIKPNVARNCAINALNRRRTSKAFAWDVEGCQEVPWPPVEPLFPEVVPRGDYAEDFIERYASQCLVVCFWFDKNKWMIGKGG